MSGPAPAPLRPWLGLASFTEAESAQFFGREDELAELLRRVQRKRLTVLFGQSGLGKTSLLQAGVAPRLRQAGFNPVLLRIDYGPESPSPAAQILAALGGPGANPSLSLWERLHEREAAGTAPLLIFDQFEEVFTLGQADEAGRAKAQAFLAELADLVENRTPAEFEARLEDDEALYDRIDPTRSDYRVLISLREDYLAHLEPLKGAMPSITQNRMRIAPMSGEQALQAVCGPGGELVSTDTAEAIVRFVSAARSLSHAEVEPALLSLILRELNEQRIARGQAQITPDLLAGSHAAILSDFYERSLSDQPAGVRHFIEDQLLTDTGYRENVAEERVQQAFAAAGASPDALAQLVNRRLLRVEERLDRRRVELTHDTLCAVVAASRDSRREREAREASERALAEQRERAQAHRKQLVRARQLAAGAVALSLAATGAGLFAWHTAQRAKAAEAKAAQARAGAEGLVGFMLDDFYEELQPLGRLDVAQRLSQRALDYYASAKPEASDLAGRRGLATAQLRQVDALAEQSKLEEADRLLRIASASLEQLYAEGDRSDALLIGLGRALAAQGDAQWSANAPIQQILAPLRRADQLLARRAMEPSADPGVRRTRSGLLELMARIHENWAGNKVAAEAAARAAYAMAQPLAGPPSALDLRLQLRALIAAVQSVGSSPTRLADAQALGRDAMAAVDRLLAIRADDATTLESRAALQLALAWSAVYGMDPEEAVRQARSAASEFARLRVRDPLTSRYANSQTFALEALRAAQVLAGQIDAAQATMDEAHKLLAGLPESSFTIGSRIELSLLEAGFHAERGDMAATEAVARRFAELFARMKSVLGGKVYENELLRDVHMAQLRALARSDEAEAAIPLRDSQVTFAKDALAAGQRYASQLLRSDTLLRLGRWSQAQPLLQDTLAISDTFNGWRVSPLSATRARIALAWAQRQSGQPEEARRTLQPVLDAMRDWAPLNRGSAWHRFVQAQALVVQGHLDGTQGKASLQQARALLAALPPDMQRTRSVQAWTRWAAQP